MAEQPKTDKVICVICPTCERIVAGECCLDYVKPSDYADVGRMVTEGFRRGCYVVARTGPVTMWLCACVKDQPGTGE